MVIGTYQCFFLRRFSSFSSHMLRIFPIKTTMKSPLNHIVWCWNTTKHAWNPHFCWLTHESPMKKTMILSSWTSKSSRNHWLGFTAASRRAIDMWDGQFNKTNMWICVDVFDIYIYIFICIHVYLYVCIYIYMYIYMYICLYNIHILFTYSVCVIVSFFV